jgi:hypothetical protein
MVTKEKNTKVRRLMDIATFYGKDGVVDSKCFKKM